MQTEKTTRDLTITVFPPDRQGSGSFDNGKITEIKPIPFPSEIGGSKRLGPIFYWAWASAKGDGIIGMHPHQGFEIVSYVLGGTLGHTDTAGNRQRVSKGGIQVMQTGSGISHQEEMRGESTDFFQVWFEPELSRALQKPPSYTDVEGDRFPLETIDSGATLKRVVGPQGAVQLDAPVQWDEVTLPSHSEYTHPVQAGSYLGIVVTEGSASLEIENELADMRRRDFVVVETGNEIAARIRNGDESATLTLISAPIDPGYPLYRM